MILNAELPSSPWLRIHLHQVPGPEVFVCEILESFCQGTCARFLSILTSHRPIHRGRSNASQRYISKLIQWALKASERRPSRPHLAERDDDEPKESLPIPKTAL